MRQEERRPQWRIDVVVYHSYDFGHQLELSTQRQGQPPLSVPIGSWKGLGIPDGVLQGARAMLDAAFTHHLVTRYGIQDELPLQYGSEVEPF